ncbi:MAG: glycosyltransferase, partial [Ignavibacteria bacterium]|nr:glycosyltransferase [Ignavibacteria bacterium]
IAWHLNQVLGNQFDKNILPDVRGANIEEIEEFSGLNKISRSLKINNNKRAVSNLKRFKKISVVSDSLKNYLVNNYGIDTSSIFITPCLAGNLFRFDQSDRESIRKDLNLSSNDLMIVFSSGGTAKWQNNDVLTLLADKGLKVLNLSKVKIEHKNIINKFVSYQDMPAYLSASDVAIIWRDKSIVNKVASPVKFSEYVCCGLPVIANKSVEMISDYLSRYDCGLLIDSLEDIDSRTIGSLVQQNRNKISEEGIQNFGINTIVNNYMRTYLLVSNL